MAQEDLKIVYVDPRKLKAADYNPRILSQQKEEQIRKSLLKFGFREPVVVNRAKGRENVLIGGHQRVRIALELGSFSKIPAVYADLTLAEEQELNVRLNDGGDWDFEKLKGHFDHGLLLDTGFGDLVEQAADADLLTRPRERMHRQNKGFMAEVESGQRKDKLVSFKLGSFIGWVPAEEYVKWKQDLHTAHGYAEDLIVAHLMEKLGIGAFKKRQRKTKSAKKSKELEATEEEDK